MYLKINYVLVVQSVWNKVSEGKVMLHVTLKYTLTEERVLLKYLPGKVHKTFFKTPLILK